MVDVVAAEVGVAVGRFDLDDVIAAESAYRMANLLDPATIDWKMGMARTLFRQERPARVVLHLLNDPNPKGLVPFRLIGFQRHREDSVPVRDIEVALRGRYARVYTVPGRTPLKARYTGSYTRVTLPVLDTHAMVVGEELRAERGRSK